MEPKMFAPPANMMSAPKLGVEQKRWNSSSQKLSAYEQKMMKRLERANRCASYEAAGVPIPGAKSKEKEETKLPPPPENGPDHEKLIHLVRGAREKGNLFFYFPEGGSRLTNDAKEVDKSMKEEERQNEELKQQNAQHPEKGVLDFMERLEEMQLNIRQEQIKNGVVEDPWKRAVVNEPVVTPAGKPHEVVIDNGSDEECEGTKPAPKGAEETVEETRPLPKPSVVQSRNVSKPAFKSPNARMAELD